MSSEGRRLGAALMESNARRIPYVTFVCTVSGKHLTDLAEEAYTKCDVFFNGIPYEITDLDADAIQTVALETIGYTAKVRARPV